MPAITHIEPISDTKTYENNAIGKEMRAKICNIFGPITNQRRSVPSLLGGSNHDGQQELQDFGDCGETKDSWLDSRTDQ